MASQVLLDTRARVWEAMKALLDATENRTLSGQEKEALAKMEGELDEYDYAIREQDKAAERRAKYETIPDTGEVPSTRAAENRETHPLTPNGPAGSAALRNAAQIAGNSTDFVHLAEYERAFDQFLRRGVSGMAPEQRSALAHGESRAQSVGTNTAGGFTVPPGFLQKITDALKAYGGMLGVSNVISTDSGQSLVWPSADDTGNTGAILAENAPITAQDITFGQKTLLAYMYTSKLVLVSYQLLQDSAFDLNAWLPGKFAQRLGRILNAHFTNGTGAGAQPVGLVPNLTTGKTGATGQTLTVAGDDLIDLIHSVDPAYRNANSKFMLADTSIKVVRKLKDTTGQYLWQPGLTAGSPDTLLGYGVVINQDMPVMAANAKSIAFGDFNAAYVIRRVQDVQVKRLEERYADALQVGFFSFCRYDGTVDDTNAAKLYVNSAT
jgi:HK97 family phage major capsid protein